MAMFIASTWWKQEVVNSLAVRAFDLCVTQSRSFETETIILLSFYFSIKVFIIKFMTTR